MDKEALFFAIANWGEFSQKRYQATLVAGEKRRIPIMVTSGRKWIIFKYRFGNIVADTLQFRFDNLLNYFEQNILVGTELLNWVVEPKPYLVASGDNGAIVVWNTDNVERDFSMVLDFYVITDEIQGRIREFVLGSREGFKAEVTSQASTGGS